MSTPPEEISTLLDRDQSDSLVLDGLSEEQIAHVHADKMELLNKEILLLDEAIEKEIPDYKSMMLKIDGILRSYPELTYKLTEEQIGTISKSLIKDSDISFFNANKSEGGAGKKLISAKEVKERMSQAGEMEM